MPRLILHLGPSKTGTTSLQTALYMNRDALLREGIFTPVFPVSAKMESHHILQALCKPEPFIQPYWRQGRHDMELVNYGAQLYARMLDQMRDHGAHTVVLSSELLWRGAYFPLFCRLLRRDFEEICPVIYFRNPKYRYRSQLQQSAKAGDFHNRILPFAPFVDHAAMNIGTRLMLLPYIEASVDKGWNVVDDFWTKVLSCAPPPDADGPRANTADSVELTLVLLLVSRFYERDNPDRGTEDEILERTSYLRNAALDLGIEGDRFIKTKRLVFSDTIEARISAAGRPDQDWFDRYMEDPCGDSGEVQQDRRDTQIFADVDELFCNTEKNLDTCMALLERLTDWLDTVIDAGDRSRRALRLRAALHAACRHLKGLQI